MERGLEYYQPEELSIRHKHIIALRAAGMRNVDIADILGFEPATVSKILGDPRSKVLLSRMSADFLDQVTTTVQEKIQGSALEAYEMILELMRTSDHDRVRQTSAFDILDRAGHKAHERSGSIQIKAEPKDIKRLVEALVESKKEPEPLEMVQDSSGVFKAADDVTSARK